jgi:hypothetical protein
MYKCVWTHNITHSPYASEKRNEVCGRGCQNGSGQFHETAGCSPFELPIMKHCCASSSSCMNWTMLGPLSLECRKLNDATPLCGMWTICMSDRNRRAELNAVSLLYQLNAHCCSHMNVTYIALTCFAASAPSSGSTWCHKSKSNQLMHKNYWQSILVTHTYVSAFKLPSSGGASKNHKYLWHPDTPVCSGYKYTLLIIVVHWLT